MKWRVNADVVDTRTGGVYGAYGMIGVYDSLAEACEAIAKDLAAGQRLWSASGTPEEYLQINISIIPGRRRLDLASLKPEAPNDP